MKNNNKQLFFSKDGAKQLFAFVFPWVLQALDSALYLILDSVSSYIQGPKNALCSIKISPARFPANQEQAKQTLS